MFRLLKKITTREIFLEQLPVLMISMAIAEVFYKFHSFTLECIAFLATWYVADLISWFIRNYFSKNKHRTVN